MVKKGEKLSKETRQKVSESMKNKHNSRSTEFKKGHVVSKETKDKISKANKGKKRTDEQKKRYMGSKKGHVVSKETREKISKSNKGKKRSYKQRKKMKGKKHSKEHKDKIRDALIGRKLSEETKEKLRISAFEYAKKVTGVLCPRIGTNEKQILDRLEKELDHKILRQYKVCGYFIDGYILKLKIAIEVDERPKNLERDLKRQKIIEEELNCKFIRINDFD